MGVGLRLGCWAAAILLAFGCEARGEESPALPVEPQPVGLGALLGDAGGRADYGLVLEGQNHFKQERGLYQLRRYGQGSGRLELGQGAGVMLEAMTGVTLVGLDGYEGLSPHLGIEPANGRISLHTGSARDSYYEWMPMASAGLQFAHATCKALPMLRAGGALGNLGKSGLVPAPGWAYGAALYLNCAQLDLAVEATSLSSGEGARLGLVDASYAVRPGGLKLGLRLENDLVQTLDGAAGLHREQRLIVLLRSRFAGFD